MATTKTFNNVRLQLKYDTLTNWTTNDPVLYAGEIALTTVPNPTGDVKQAPAVLMKVGDGKLKFSELQFTSALAANVHSWALAATKPSYNANEIGSLTEYINGVIQDTNTTYRLAKTDDYNYKLQSKELNGEWADVDGSNIKIPKYDDTKVKSDIATLNTLVGNTAVKTQIDNAIAALKLAETYDTKGSASSALADAKAYTDTLKNGAVATNTADIAAIKDGTTIDSFADVESTISANAKTAADATAKALTDAKTYADGKDVAIAAAKKAGDDAQADVNALKSKVGTVTTGKTVAEMISDGDTSTLANAKAYTDTLKNGAVATNTADIAAIKKDYLKNADKTALQDQITTNANAIAALNGTDEGSVDAKITAAFNKFTADLTDDDTVNTYKELVDYAAEHKTEAASMAANITKNTNSINTLNGKMSTAQNDIDALEVRATTAEGDIDALEARVTTAEGDIDALEGRATTLEGKAHTHSNKTVLDGISSEKVSLWDTTASDLDKLEAAVGTVTSGKTVVEMINDAKNAAISSATYNDTEVRGLIKTNTNNITSVSERVTSLEKNAVLNGDTLILNCGTSVL